MSNLVVFGDSFADTRWHSKEHASFIWVESLAKKLKLEAVSYGLNGTSIQYSFLKLYEYLNSDTYSTEDIIVFVCTSNSRSPIVDASIDPQTSAHWIRFLENDSGLKKDIDKHYRTNETFYRTLFKYYNFDLAHQVRSNVAFLLKSIPNRSIIISAFDDIDFSLIESRKFLLRNDPKFLLINAKLIEISNKEIIGEDFIQFHNFFGAELRATHLSRSNNEILADQLYKCITNRSDKYFDKTQYKKNFIPLRLDSKTEELFNEEFLPDWKIKMKHGKAQ